MSTARSVAALLLFASLPIKLTAADQGALAALTEARVLSERVGYRVWPGYSLGRQELLAYDGNRLQLLVGASGRPVHFAPVPGAGFGVLGHQGRLPEIAHATSPAVWLGKTPVVALPYRFLENDDQPQPDKVFTPAFGAWQHRHFAGVSQYGRLEALAHPAGSAGVRAAAELEDHLLADALRSPDPAQRRTDAREFLAVRARRRTHLSKTTSRFEDLAETFRGLPFYVADSYSDYAALDPGFLSSAVDPADWRRWSQSTGGVAGALDLPLDPSAMGTQRFGLTGLAQARLLDELSAPSWRAAAQRGTPLDLLLARAVAMPWKDLPALLRSGRSAGGWGDLLLAIRDPSREFPPPYRAWLQTAGRKLTCWLSPTGGHLSLHYQNRPIEIDAHTLFAATLTAFDYNRRQVALHARDVPMLWHGPDIEWPYQQVSFHLPPGASVELDGQPLTHDGSFRIRGQFSVKAAGIRIVVPAGRVLVRGRNLDVRPRYGAR